MIKPAGAFQPVQPVHFGARQPQVAASLMGRLQDRLAEDPEIEYHASPEKGDEVMITRKPDGDVEFIFAQTSRSITIDADGTVEEAIGDTKSGKISKGLARDVVESFLSIFFEDPFPQPEPPAPPAADDDEGDPELF